MSGHEDFVRANYEAFLKLLPALLEEREGKFALMRNLEVVDFYDTANDAFLAGHRLFADGRFSIQEVTSTALDLGFYSHALD